MRAGFTRLRRERDANGVANAFLQQYAQHRGRRHRALGAHAGFGQAQVQGVGGAFGQLTVHRDKVLHAADLARQDDLLMGHAHVLRQRGRFERRGDQRFVHHLFGVPGRAAGTVDVHQAGQQFLVQATPVDADANGLFPSNGRFDHLAELPVVLVALANIAGVNAVLGQRLGAGREVGQQAVAVVMKIADQRHVDAHAVELVAHMRHGFGGFGRVDRDTDHLGAGQGQFLDLNGGADDIHRIGVGHGLNAHRRVAAHGDHARAPNHASLRRAACQRGCTFDWKARLHGHFTSKRATLSRAIGARSRV